MSRINIIIKINIYFVNNIGYDVYMSTTTNKEIKMDKKQLAEYLKKMSDKRKANKEINKKKDNRSQYWINIQGIK